MSRIKRRSGNAVAAYCDLIGWRPSALCMVGVGLNHEEVYVFREKWSDLYIYGWEPNPHTYGAINDDFPGMLWPVAISDKHGYEKLRFPHNGKDGGTLLGRDRFDVEVDVHVRPLDWMPSGYSPFEDNALLWLDCEGSELAAIQGGQQFIKDRVSMINVEMTGKPYGSGWPKPREVHEALTALGFKQAWIHTIRTHVGQFDCVYVCEDLYNPDLVCCF